MPHHESSLRSVAKALSWKLLAALLMLTTSYFFTGNIVLATKFTIVTTAIGLVAFYFHERLWNRVHWGREEI